MLCRTAWTPWDFSINAGQRYAYRRNHVSHFSSLSPVQLTSNEYGDVFTFTLFGRKITCYLGLEGNEFILNGKLQDVNAEEVYGPLTTPVFGSDVIYDCPNSKLMEQKKFVKFGLTQNALESHVPLIEKEVLDYIKSSVLWKGASGVVDISGAMSEITLFTAARSLQGKEVRRKLTAEFASLYHDLDMVSFIRDPILPLNGPMLTNTQLSIRALLQSTSFSLGCPCRRIAVEMPPTPRCVPSTRTSSTNVARAASNPTLSTT